MRICRLRFLHILKQILNIYFLYILFPFFFWFRKGFILVFGVKTNWHFYNCVSGYVRFFQYLFKLKPTAPSIHFLFNNYLYSIQKFCVQKNLCIFREKNIFAVLRIILNVILWIILTLVLWVVLCVFLRGIVLVLHFQIHPFVKIANSVLS